MLNYVASFKLYKYKLQSRELSLKIIFHINTTTWYLVTNTIQRESANKMPDQDFLYILSAVCPRLKSYTLVINKDIRWLNEGEYQLN